ncbi:S8 family serine peptidase [Altererythrobacter sp.]|uniref:S8 family serine peptidase n=1 Tax=Altererythrobacter sp. TaxID=1872480 RepID=UPI003D0AA549
MHVRIFLISLGLALLAAPLSAQLGLPQVELPQTGTVLDPVTGSVLDPVLDVSEDVTRKAARLADLRERRLDRLVRRNRDIVELDAAGAPARKGTLLLIDASAQDIATAQSLGFEANGIERIDGLELVVTRLALPEGLTLAGAQRKLQEVLPQAEISADNLHFRSGPAAALPLMAQPVARSIATPVGIIDGAPGDGIAVQAVRGFADGAPYPSNHGSAVTSLLRYAGVRTIRVADVYGTDKAGGNALAIARALGWLVESGSKVINISLVGPQNALLQRAVASAQAKGVVVVAAVGNDGPASPPSYPASYSKVLAVTAVDRHDRALIEAGRALHLDYAAPGADIFARNAKGGRMKLRGTSFATPLVAARLAATLDHGGGWRQRLDAEARDLGKKGPDGVYGRGLLCGACRPSR